VFAVSVEVEVVIECESERTVAPERGD